MFKHLVLCSTFSLHPQITNSVNKVVSIEETDPLVFCLKYVLKYDKQEKSVHILC